MTCAIMFFLALLCAGIAVGGYIGCGPRVLFRWYLREIQGLKVAQDRTESIVTYPFA